MPRLLPLSIPLPVTFLGCGKLASAILDGLLTATYAQPPPMKSSFEGDGIATPDSFKTFVPTSLVACVHQQSSADALLAKYENNSIVHVLQDANVHGTSLGSVILLGCKPTAYKEILSAEGMKEALSGQKVLINFMVGVSPRDLSETIYGPGPFSRGEVEQQCVIVNVTPNTAAAVRQSMTLIYEDEAPLPAWALEIVVALFNRVGEVKRIPHSLRHLAPVMSTLTASTAAFFAVALEGVAQGAIEGGLNQTTAMEIAAVAMAGAAGLVAGGETVEAVRKRIATKGGSTAKGLEVLKREGVLAAMAEAMRTAAEAAGRMGNADYWKGASEVKEGGTEELEPQQHESEEQESQEQQPGNQTVQAEDTEDADLGK